MHIKAWKTKKSKEKTGDCADRKRKITKYLPTEFYSAFDFDFNAHFLFIILDALVEKIFCLFGKDERH